jgi:predicted DNA binding CopG/RHH family protein
MNKPDPKSLDRRLTLRLPAKLLKQLKVAAAQADLNLQNYVLNTLTKEVRR